jgi:hypothetical protein
MDQHTKKKIITIAIAFLIFAVSYFIVKSKYIKSKPTGYKKTVLLHKDGKVIKKTTYEETYCNFQFGFFILTLTFLILLFGTYFVCFKRGESCYSVPELSSSIEVNSIQPLI